MNMEIKSNKLILYVMADFETSQKPNNENGVYAWLCGFKICGLMDMNTKEFIEHEYLGLPKDVVYSYGKHALKDWLNNIFNVAKVCKEYDIEVHLFFHNARYDFSYIQYHILKYCGKYDSKNKDYYMSNVVIDDNSTFYSCNISQKIRTRKGNNGKKKQITNSITIHDLYKILPSRLADIGKSVGYPKGKDFDYEMIRDYNYIPTDEELKGYFFGDIEIMCLAYRKLPKFFYGYYTIGSIVKNYFLDVHLKQLDKYKHTNKKPSEIKENLFGVKGDINCYVFDKNNVEYAYTKDVNSAMSDIMIGYKGGMTIANNEYIGKTIYNDKLPLTLIPKENGIKIKGDIYHYDVNSLYPSQMLLNDFPIGKPIYISSLDYESNKDFEKYLINEMNENKKKIIINVRLLNGRVKKDKAPLFLKTSAKKELFGYSNSNDINLETNGYKAFYETFNNDIETLTLEEFLYLKNNYNVIYEIRYAYMFNSMSNLFKTFIDEMSYLKIKYDNDEFLRLCYKLCMNNLYGKFGEKVEKTTLKRLLDEDNHWCTGDDNIKEYKIGKYFCPPIAVYITSYARLSMMKYINMVGWKNVLYMDTDSVHLIGEKLKNKLEKNNCVHDTELGKLKLEDICYGEKCLSPKKYAYYGLVLKKNKIKFSVKCAGLPQQAQEQIKDFDMFNYGLTFIPKELISENNTYKIKKGNKYIEYSLPNNYIPCGKLSQAYVDGGIFLQKCIFSIKVPDYIKLKVDLSMFENININIT